MGLLIAVGDTKPEFSYDQWYGIEWDETVDKAVPSRVGNMELHKSLPLQGKMARCLLNDDGSPNYYLGATDSTKRDSGSDADLTGSSGQVMVEVPDTYFRFEQDGTTRRCLMSEYKLPGFTLWEQNYVGAFEGAVQRSTTTLCSVVNTDADYRGGNNTASYDGTYRSQLGLPATSISNANFQTYARRRGTEWNAYLHKSHKHLFWFFAVEYCTFNTQAAYNGELTAEGYRQGGLGSGVTTLNSTKWSNFNGQGPFIPCGHTCSLGNETGCVDYTMPFEYDASGEECYAGEYDSATAYVSGQYVSDGDALYSCKADAPAGTSLTDTAYFSSVTRTVVSVPSYRGVENVFGHIWKTSVGGLCSIQPDDEGGRSIYYYCDDPSKFSTTSLDNYTEICDIPRSNGYVTSIAFGADGEIMPLAIGGSSSTYYHDYFYTSIPDTTTIRCVLFGGVAADGASAGFVYAFTHRTPSNAHVGVGSRLCFKKAKAA